MNEIFMEKKTCIKKLREEGRTYKEIANLFGCTFARIWQINRGYKTKNAIRRIDPKNHKTLIAEKMRELEIPYISMRKLIGNQGGLSSVREVIRIRDKRQCKICF